MSSKLDEAFKKIPTKKTVSSESMLTKIRSELKKMDESFFKELIRKAKLHQEAFKNNRSNYHEYLSEFFTANYEQAEVKYKGYKKILDDPSKIDSISKEVKNEVERLDKVKEIALTCAIDFQKKTQLSLENMKNNNFDEDYIRAMLPDAIFVDSKEEKEFKKLNKIT